MARFAYYSWVVLAVIFLVGISTEPVHAQCPAVGADTNCGIVITVTDTGASLNVTGQGPYDSIEDTLIGVVNNSRLPVSALGLRSSLSIFSFDGDGIDTYGVQGNSQDSTGYGGPNAYFSNISADRHSGTVHFITPISAHGGTAYFSLEEAISAATACTTLLNHSISGPNLGFLATQITASFKPKLGYTLAQAAQLCGFIEFDWQQTITMLPAPSPFFAAGSTVPLTAPPPFNDPPPQGYSYQHPPNAVELPVYWNLFTSAPNPLSLGAHETSTTVSFIDGPADNCLPGGSGSACGGHTAPAGSKLAFRTHLVGIAGALPGADVVDTGLGFTWTDTFNGTSGGISVTNSTVPVDPGSGTGGIVVNSVSETPTLSGISVTSVNGEPPGKLPTLTAGNACDGAFGGTFTGNITVSAGQTCTFVNGTITGNVQVNGGILNLSGTLISGNLEIDGGSFSMTSFSAVGGDTVIKGLTSGTSANQLCDSIIYGSLDVDGNGVAVQVGSNSSSSSCPGNVVGGSLQVLGNSGPMQVFGNTVTKSLECKNNSTITGGANVADDKEGQCANF